MQLHNADGFIDAVLRQPDKCARDFWNWRPLKVDIVYGQFEGQPCVEIADIYTGHVYDVSMFELLPRALCWLDRPFDVLRQLVRIVREPGLQSFISHVFEDPCVFTQFLMRPAFKDSFNYPGGIMDRAATAMLMANDMKVSSKEEREFLLTAALAFDIGGVKDRILMSGSLRDECGFIPHPKTVDVASYAIASVNNDIGKRLKEVLQTGHCDYYPSLRYDLGEKAALATIDAAIRDRRK